RPRGARSRAPRRRHRPGGPGAPRTGRRPCPRTDSPDRGTTRQRSSDRLDSEAPAEVTWSVVGRCLRHGPCEPVRFSATLPRLSILVPAALYVRAMLGERRGSTRQVLPEGIEERAPSAELAFLLESIEDTALNGYELVLYIQATRRLLDDIQAKAHHAIVELASRLDASDDPDRNGYELVLYIQAIRRLWAHFQAKAYHAIVELAHTPPCDPDDPPDRTEVPDEFIPDELSAALRLTNKA